MRDEDVVERRRQDLAFEDDLQAGDRVRQQGPSRDPFQDPRQGGAPGEGKGKLGAKGAPGKGGKAKGGYQPPEGPAPKTPWGTPDLNGVWARPYTPDMERSLGSTLPYTEWGKQKWDSYNPEKDGDYTGACLPFGHMRSINGPDPVQIMQTPTHLAFLYEQNTWFKVLPIDGRQPKKKVPTWYGDSVGRWDGDTLVVETSNFNGFTRLDTNGHPHSDQLKVTERFTRISDDQIEYKFTVEDPLTWTRPWTAVNYLQKTNGPIFEFACHETNIGVSGILAGARAEEKRAAEAKSGSK